jgi:hypothetical protein
LLKENTTLKYENNLKLVSKLYKKTKRKNQPHIGSKNKGSYSSKDCQTRNQQKKKEGKQPKPSIFFKNI